MSNLRLPDDAFGDPFDIGRLPLPRPAVGYAVQWLDTDLLLDRRSADFLPVRSPDLTPVFRSFSEAHAAASGWLAHRQDDGKEVALAIVPVGYDLLLGRHILIYGVLTASP